MPDPRMKNIRDMKITTDSGVNVKDTEQLSGEAGNELSGKNTTVQYSTTAEKNKGALGGEASYD